MGGLRRQEPVVVEVQQVKGLAVGGSRRGGVLRGLDGEVLGEEAGERDVVAVAGGDVVESLEDEEGELVLEEEEVAVHVLHGPGGVDKRIGGAVLSLEEELEDEAAVEEEHLGKLPRRERHRLGVAAARAGLEGPRGAGVGRERRVGVPGEEVAEVTPLVLLHGAEAGGPAVQWTDGDHLRLVEMAVALAHRPRHAEDAEGFALVRLAWEHIQAALHARCHLVGLGILLLVADAGQGGSGAFLQPALHALVIMDSTLLGTPATVAKDDGAALTGLAVMVRRGEQWLSCVVHLWSTRHPSCF
ncbi:unnamed protein product [Alopecurus aequalis]